MDEYSDPYDEETAEDEVERQFWQLTNSLMIPHDNECLVCFLVRAVPMLEPEGFAMTRVFRDTNAPRATNLGPRLSQLGVYSDAHSSKRASWPMRPFGRWNAALIAAFPWKRLPVSV